MNPFDVCIYHADCNDGFAAAWVVWQHSPNAKFFAANYGEPLPLTVREMLGSRIIIVDFSYPPDIMQRLLNTANFVAVLDHHKTAKQDLEPFIGSTNQRHIEFDMLRSGAMMAWHYLFPDEHNSILVEYVQDRDLWTFKAKDSESVNSYIDALPMDFPSWSKAEDMIGNHGTDVRKLGDFSYAYFCKMVKDAVDQTFRYIILDGHSIPVANLPRRFASTGAKYVLTKALEQDYDADFCAAYYDTATCRKFSLRTRSNRIDVSAIARKYGTLHGTTSGGHAAAAGFEAPIGWEGD